MSDEDKSGMPDTQYAGGGGNQKAIQVGFSLVILCWYWYLSGSFDATFLPACLLMTSTLLRILDPLC